MTLRKRLSSSSPTDGASAALQSSADSQLLPRWSKRTQKPKPISHIVCQSKDGASVEMDEKKKMHPVDTKDDGMPCTFVTFL
ncbi:hypothetical protein NQZ68_027265 [Dissostichus eleginoides]|nr:hypothetical protein NQZ68_027265 [Dissostichus eleginoides]